MIKVPFKFFAQLHLSLLHRGYHEELNGTYVDYLTQYDYETAWTMPHRLRRAMVRPNRDLLHGEVEVDETYLSLTDRIDPISPIGRKSNTTKVLVVIAVEMLRKRLTAPH
jgi:hypothetical protein